MKSVITTIILIFLFATFNVANGQGAITNSEYEAKPTKKIERPNAIFFAPLNLFDFRNPNFQIGYERFISNKWTLQIEGGIITYYSITDLIIYLMSPYTANTNIGFRVKGSTKYITLEKRKFKLYVSPELFYCKNKSKIVRTFLISDPDFEYSSAVTKWQEGDLNLCRQSFYNDEEKMGINFKVGLKFLFGKQFFIEPHFGLGLAYRNVIQTGIENPNDKIYDKLHDNLYGPFDKAAPNKWIPSLPLNLKVGVRF